MKKKSLFLLIGTILSLNSAFAQYAEDALRFSQTEQGATARMKALGNAQTALGGDLSSLSGNPAGLGLFTSSEINFTADFTNTNVSSTYFGQNTGAQLDKLGLTQIGGVWHSQIRHASGSDLKTGWLSFNFGISYNKTNNFNSNLDYQGTNPNSSFADYLADITNKYLAYGDPAVNDNAISPDFYSLEDMAYGNFLTEYNPGGYFATTGLNNKQRNTVYRSGNQSEVNFGFGANYSNQLFIGASLGLTSLNYTADRQFSEAGRTRDFAGQQPEFADASYSLGYRSFQNTTGSGLNIKLGVIYRATDNVRIGFDFISPSWYSLSDSYSEGLDTRYTQADGTSIPPYTNDDVVYDFTYTLRTPYRVNGGVAVTFANRGLITGDVEYVDYASMHITAKNDRSVEEGDNRSIRDTYTSAVNFRVGAEYKLNNNFSLRGGYNTTGNPYKHLDYATENISGGLGYRSNNFYMDLTYLNAVAKYSNRPYQISESYPDYDFTGPGEAASIKNTRGSVFLTVGTRF